MDAAMIGPRLMALRLAAMLKPDADAKALPAVRLTPRYNGLFGLSGETCSVTFGLGEREVTVLYPARDLTLTMDEFAERHLAAAAKALA
jgi:hypothetical protein